MDLKEKILINFNGKNMDIINFIGLNDAHRAAIGDHGHGCP